jgi:hypothetical protein
LRICVSIIVRRSAIDASKRSSVLRIAYYKLPGKLEVKTSSSGCRLCGGTDNRNPTG